MTEVFEYPVLKLYNFEKIYIFNMLFQNSVMKV